jgi:hypothetical protein
MADPEDDQDHREGETYEEWAARQDMKEMEEDAKSPKTLRQRHKSLFDSSSQDPWMGCD